jgi:hypothetical protein
VAPKKCLSFIQKVKPDVRQSTADRGSASITNLVVVEGQQLQRLVLTANKSQPKINNAPLAHQTSTGVK